MPRLGKDQRAKFLAEYEKDGKITSDPNYYAVKTKAGKVQIRRVKAPKTESSSETSSEQVPEQPKEEQVQKPKKEKTL